MTEQHPTEDGAALLGELRAAFQRYVILPNDASYDAVTLWTAATHAQSAWQCAPRLAIISPEKRCGKSRLLDVITETCHAPMITVNISAAAVFRSITNNPPTLLVDEADTIFGTKKAAEANEELRGLLNAGHQRNRPTIRCVPPTMEPKRFPTFAMAALAGIGDLPDTIMDRSVPLHMRRRALGETVAPLRLRRDVPGLNEIRDKIARWLQANISTLECAEPDMPLEDRAADTWEPLVAVADLAGGDWPENARTAAKFLVGGETEEDATTSAARRLLSDLRVVLGDADRMHGQDILAALHKIEEAPWPDYFGKPINPNQVAKLLKPYGVKPRDVNINKVNLKGYYRTDLWDAWTRYLPETAPSNATGATTATAQVAGGSGVAGSALEALPATRGDALTSDVAAVAAVAGAGAVSGHQAAAGCSWCGKPLTAVVDRALGIHDQCLGESD
jgi:hypothetical protein